MPKWLGIDFSGDHKMWRPECQKSNVWIAELEENGPKPRLSGLRRVQQLPGAAQPFERLTQFLVAGEFSAAAIDAPFSLPEEFVNPDHAGLLRRVACVPRDSRRPFLSGSALLAAVLGPDAGRGVKKYRITERIWRVNVRSTLWAGPRGGAAMTAACLSLLARANRPIWPWADNSSQGLLVEAFPTAQLKHWGLPSDRYNGCSETAKERRSKIFECMAHRIEMGPEAEKEILSSADALDAIVCAFAAIAVTSEQLARNPEPIAEKEGWIAVHL